MKFNLKFLVLLPIIFMFLPAFAFVLPGTKQVFQWFYPVLYFTIFVILLASPKKFLGRIKYAIKHTPFKIFAALILLMALNTTFLAIIGTISVKQAIRSIVFTVGLQIIPIFAYFIGVIGSLIPIKKFIQCFMLLYTLMLFIGFIAYFGQLLNITIISDIFDFFANARILAWEANGIDMVSDLSNYEAFGLPRLDNLFQEPSDYAHFLCMFLPLILVFQSSKSKLFKNKIMVALIRYAVVPLTFISIVLTLSPIALVLVFILLLILYWHIIKKHFIPVAFISLILIFCLFNLDLSDTYLSRIVNVFTEIKTFEDFIHIEPSLATRIINYTNILCVFLHYPIFGVGMGNIGHALVLQLLQSPLPLTPEIQIRYMILVPTIGKVLTNANYYYVFLAENGIFLFSLYVYFYYKLSRISLQLTKLYLKRDDLINSDFSKALNGCLISIIIIAIYNLNAQCLINYMYMIFSLIICLIIHYRKGVNKNEKNNNDR